MKIFILLLLSGVISVDRNNALNLMLSRPIVIAMIASILYGGSETLILIGIIFELIGLIDLPVGAHIPKDDTFAAYAMCAIYVLGYLTNVVDFIIAFLSVLLLMRFLTAFDVYTRNISRKLYNKFERLENFDSGRLLYAGVFISFLKGLIFYNLATFIVILVVVNIYIPIELNINLYLSMIVVIVSAYFLEFVDIRGFRKHLLLIGGFLIGWLIG